MKNYVFTLQWIICTIGIITVYNQALSKHQNDCKENILGRNMKSVGNAMG
jgi:hypothetical protein